MATDPGTCLRPCEAAELSDLLQFLDGWLTAGHGDLHEPLARSVGSPAYGISHLQDDIRRFAFLLGADNGTQLFGR